VESNIGTTGVNEVEDREKIEKTLGNGVGSKKDTKMGIKTK
jgi:hypothetical protein